MNDRRDRFYETFGACSPFFRDTTLTEHVLNRYKIGLFLREPTFCDATYKEGGLVAPHRYLIISSNGKCVDAVSQSPEWGLCLWAPPVFFKVIDQAIISGYVQTTLLEIPAEFLDIFCRPVLVEEHEGLFVAQAHASFERCVNLEPLEELNTEKWRERLTFPVGIDDRENYFSLFPSQDVHPENASLVWEVLNHQAEVHLRSGNEDDALPLLKQARSLSPPS